MKAEMNLYQPIDQDSAHLLIDISLFPNIVTWYRKLYFQLAHVRVDLVDVLGAQLRVFPIVLVDILDSSGRK